MFCDFINSFFSVPDLQYIQLSVQGYKECQFSDSDLSLLKEDLDLMSVQHSLGQPSNFPRVDIVKLQKNNVTLFNLNLFPLLYQDLKLLNNLNNTPNLDHMHFLISLLYLLILSNVEDPSLSKQLVEDTEPPFVVFLFNLVLKLADGNKNHYPVKKILMLLDKVLESSLCISNLENCKEISRKCNNLRRSCKNRITKCNPLDIQLQKSYLELKYPSYIARDIPELKKYNIVLEQEANLKFMTQSLTNVPHNYSNTNNVPLRVQQQQNIYPVIQPLVSSCNEPPNYFSETFDISKKNLFVKLSFLQMYREKEIFRRTVEMNEEEKSNFFEFIRDSKETSNTNDNAKNELCWLNDDVYNSNKVKGEFATECLCQLRRIETVYKCILPLLNSYISTLIRLVYYVNLGPQQQQEQNQKQEENLTSKQLRSKLLVNFDHAKQKHVMTLAMSNIMVNILKALKVHNVFCFEFVSTLLNDNNCGILILKMLSTWFQNLNTTPQHEAAQKTEQNSSYGTWLSDAEEPDELK
ncbi:hypothetical protein HK099_005441 [Clydaea vesicula]|uniref:Far11/STRP N-terminal domain-containing protein n=1 Tax=Clydaea vesicula TaxID=447962 RepID=A0AAD5TZ97_9FUNG|nr:hypothetical protein HK099_005441 [Clydaea vesicula]